MIKRILNSIGYRIFYKFYDSKKKNVGLANETNRSNWIEQKLKNIPTGGRILDAGAGEQPYKKHCTHLKYVSQDFSQYNPANYKDLGLHMGKWDYTGIDIVSDITNIPEKDESFDVILCTEVLEHVPDPAKAIIEFKRLLKSNGILILTAPFCSLTHFAPYHFSTGFNKFYYEHHLNGNGFEILETNLNGNFFEYLAQEIHRLPSIANRYTEISLTLKEEVAISVLIKMLDKLSKKDKGSNELLVFGIHTLARKK